MIGKWGSIAGSISAILGLLTLLLWNPIKRRLKAKQEAKEKERKALATFQQKTLESLDGINATLKGLIDDIADLQYERLSQAHEYYTGLGWCTGAKKQMLCQMHDSYRRKGRNHLSEKYEEDILQLADRPEKGR